MADCRYELNRKYVSYDDGKTWTPTNETKYIDVVEDSDYCNGNVYRWVEINDDTEYICMEGVKYRKQYMEVSTDGSNWSLEYPTVYRLGTVIDNNSDDCKLSYETGLTANYDYLNAKNTSENVTISGNKLTVMNGVDIVDINVDSSITEVSIPYTVRYLSVEMREPTNINIPDSVEKLHLYGTLKTNKLTLPKKLRVLFDSRLFNTDIETIDIPDYTEIVGEIIFDNKKDYRLNLGKNTLKVNIPEQDIISKAPIQQVKLTIRFKSSVIPIIYMSTVEEYPERYNCDAEVPSSWKDEWIDILKNKLHFKNVIKY